MAPAREICDFKKAYTVTSHGFAKTKNAKKRTSRDIFDIPEMYVEVSEWAWVEISCHAMRRGYSQRKTIVCKGDFECMQLKWLPISMHKSLCCNISLWPEGCYFHMAKSNVDSKLCKHVAVGGRAIVSFKHFGNSKYGKNIINSWYYSSCWGSVENFNYRISAKCSHLQRPADSHQIVTAHRNLHSDNAMVLRLASNAICSYDFNFSINVGKPYLISQKTFGFRDTLMAPVSKVQDSLF